MKKSIFIAASALIGYAFLNPAFAEKIQGLEVGRIAYVCNPTSLSFSNHSGSPIRNMENANTSEVSYNIYSDENGNVSEKVPGSDFYNGKFETRKATVLNLVISYKNGGNKFLGSSELTPSIWNTFNYTTTDYFSFNKKTMRFSAVDSRAHLENFPGYVIHALGTCRSV